MEVKIHKQGVKYKTDEERQKANRASKLKYSKKPWTCDKCKVTVKIGNKYRHLQSKRHKSDLKNKKYI